MSCNEVRSKEGELATSFYTERTHKIIIELVANSLKGGSVNRD